MIFLLLISFLSLSADAASAEGVVAYHPRVWITPEYAKILHSRVKPATKQWGTLSGGYHGVEWIKRKFVENGSTSGPESIIPLGLAYQATGDRGYADAAAATIIRLLSKDLSPKGSFTKTSELAESMKDIAVGFDWVYDILDEKQKSSIIEAVNGNIDKLLKDYLSAPWHGHAIRSMLAIGIWGYASYGDNPRAGEYIRHAREDRFDKLLEGMNMLFGKGGGLPAGVFYDFATEILQYTEAVYTATGENLYDSSDWFKDRMEFLLLSDYPGIFYDNNRSGYSNLKYDGTYGAPDKIPYIGYFVSEDGHRGRSTSADNIRTQKLILINHYKGSREAKELQYSITKKYVDKMCNPETHKAWQEFLWFDPSEDSATQAPLSHYAPGTGIVFMRSDWSDQATWIYFKCGDIYSTSHQHWDQNSFSIFKGGDLAIKSGLYDGDGTAGHVVNYFSRTIGSNSVLVYDPDEMFTSWRGVKYPKLLNEGGQKAYREMNEFRDVGHWKEYSDTNDTGTILGYEDASNYTYVCGDATNAYNNPRNCTPKVIWKKFTGKNDPKVSLFTRTLIFLRPDHIVVFDRVSAMKPEFKKRWLLHFLNKPSIYNYRTVKDGDAVSGGTVYEDADNVIAEAGKGKLFLDTILPEKRHIRLVGGRRAQDYWVFGKNAAPYKNMSRWQNDYGEWRIEVEPAIPAKDDIFLNVLYPCGADVNKFPESSLVKSAEGNMLGARIADASGSQDWVILFTGDKKKMPRRATFEVTGTAKLKGMLCDVMPGAAYEIKQGGNLISKGKASPQGILYFETALNDKSVFVIEQVS